MRCNLKVKTWGWNLEQAVANSTLATFLRVVGSELIQKYLGDGPKLVRELFCVADELSPSIVLGRNWCRWDKEVGFPLAQHWIEQSNSSSTGTLLIVQTWGMCCRVGLWGSCTTWQIWCTLRGRVRDSKNYAGVVESVGWIWCTCWCESNFGYQSHWEFRSSSVVALRACMFVTLGLEICSQCGFLAMANVEDRDMELAIWKRVW